MSPPSETRNIVIIAGETSGDAHGAHLVRAMKKRDESLFFVGIGGERLKAEGVDIIMDAAELSVVGITEVFSKISKVLQGIGEVKRIMRERRPELIILIDFPDFNLLMARYAKKRNIPVLYYISPQIWAWRSGRIKQIKKYVDRMAVILPFEAAYYRNQGVSVNFVGHPLLDYYEDSGENAQKQPGSPPVIGILPGSRRSEIEKNLPVMLAAVSLLQRRFPEMQFLISLAPSIDRQWVQSFITPYTGTCRIELVAQGVAKIFEKADLIVAASGTVTLEIAMHGIPMVIVYRISPVSFMLGRALINVSHIGLVNLIAGEPVAPELIQEQANPKRIAAAVSQMIENPEETERIREKLRSVRARLGQPGASEKTADIAMSMLEPRASIDRDPVQLHPQSEF